MFTIEELFSKKNQKLALCKLQSKKDSSGSDGVLLSEFEEYWKLNKERILDEIKQGIYTPGVVKCFDVISNTGKQRVVSQFCAQDRFIGRLLAQKLERYLKPDSMLYSYAYQEGKSIIDAVQQAKKYMESGDKYVAFVDIKDYFDAISLDKLTKLLKERFTDERVYKLLLKYLYCKIDIDGHIFHKDQGILQGNPISPVLSNYYLNNFDRSMQEKGYHWIRFADNIYVFGDSEEYVANIYNEICKQLREIYLLKVNKHKSGVFEATSISMLGYDFTIKNGKLEVVKHHYQKSRIYNYWHPSVIQRYSNEYHIINEGILTRKDYSLLFENEEEKHYIPVEVVQQINFYTDVTIAGNVLKTLSDKQIRASFFDKYGHLIGHYIPEKNKADGTIFLKQCEVYNDAKMRAGLAKDMELAAIHNIRANIRYYNKKIDLSDQVKEMSEFMKMMNEGNSVEQFLLVEARARQIYYQVFNKIIDNADFRFEKRTKRPPKDAINTLISFGNTLLYNQFLQFIWHTSLEPKIGIIHATNRRTYSLNLDFADIFKPIIVDRVIFKLINCKQIQKEHFETNEDGGVFLSKEGKRVFIREFQQKLASKIVVNGVEFTYYKLMEQEVHHFLNYIKNGEKYKPYKYY